MDIKILKTDMSEDMVADIHEATKAVWGKHKLHKDLATVSRFGFLYLGYAKHAWYWEAIGTFLLFFGV